MHGVRPAGGNNKQNDTSTLNLQLNTPFPLSATADAEVDRDIMNSSKDGLEKKKDLWKTIKEIIAANGMLLACKTVHEKDVKLKG